MAAETTGHDADLWRRLVELGAIELALQDDEDGSVLLDLALVAEKHGRFTAPTPMIEAQVAARLLRRSGAFSGPVEEAAISDGSRLVTIAVRPAQNGLATLVPAGAIADEVLVLVGDELLLAPLEGRATAVENLGNMPLADVAVAVENAVVLAEGAPATELFENAVDEWRTLTAAALTGLASRALEIGVDYVKGRKAFGQPVGQFQSVAHRLADRASEVDGAELLAREAAWAASVEPNRFRSLAAMSLAFSAETAIATTHDSLHFHGGYGFMLEYAIQLYYRRARSWGAVLESPATSYGRVAAQRLANANANANGAA